MPSRTKSLLSPIGVLALSLGAMACTGVMDNKDTMGTGGSAASTGGTQGVPVDPGIAKTQPVDPGHVAVHRLNTNEYNATIADVLGTKLQPAKPELARRRARRPSTTWRRCSASMRPVPSLLRRGRSRHQRRVANDAARAKILSCTTQDDQACVKSILTTSGTRIFRRPLTDKEITTYSKVYTGARTAGDDHSASVRLMIQSLLSSAEFLYRIEFDRARTRPSSTRSPRTRLASRLSYFLWGSAPDDQLLGAAANNTLANDDVLKGAVDYMLGDPKSNRFVTNFAGQWLGIRRVVPHPAAPDIYPDWTPVVADAASQEMYLYFNEFLRSGRTWLDFMKADVNYVTPELAKLYNMPVPAGATAGGAPVRVEGVADGRRGFAGLVGFLAMSSPDRRSSPTLRGKWLLMNMMCTTRPIRRLTSRCSRRRVTRRS